MAEERTDLWKFASPPGYFEYVWLDNDGGTTQLERPLWEGNSLPELELRAKYGHLEPSDFQRFEPKYLDRDVQG